MKSPFPGMDPYLESHCGDVHTSLATYAKDQLQRRLPRALIARVEERVAVESNDFESDFRPHGYYPDVRSEERSRNKSATIKSQEFVAVADTIEVLRMVEPFTQRSIHIIEPKEGNRIVTAIEFLSRANKIGRSGRDDYAKKRTELLEASVNLVEIDLIREGVPNLAVDIANVPAAYRGPYRISVVRSWRNNSVSLRNRLPIVSLPLRRKDKEVPLDLQALIDQVYENGRYDETNYGSDPEPPLPAKEAAWANQLLRKKGVRT